MKQTLTGLIVVLAIGNVCVADTINVPYDYPTITTACVEAGVGDTIGVYPGTYYEEASIPEGVSLIGITPDSMLVRIKAGGNLGPFMTLPGTAPVRIENMAIWGGTHRLILNQNPNLSIFRCYLYAYDEDGSGEYYQLIESLESFEIRNCHIIFLSFAENIFQLWTPDKAVLMKDCVVFGDAFDEWYAPSGSKFDIRNNTIDGWVSARVTQASDIVIRFTNNIMNGALCPGLAPDTLEWRFNDFIGPGAWPECGVQIGNFEGDPLYCNPFPDPELDYRLQPDSPCIGAGENGDDIGARIGICWDPAGVGLEPVEVGRGIGRAWPNPSKGNVYFTLEESGGVMVDVYDARGRKLKNLETNNTGLATWDGTLHNGNQAPSGVYYLRVSSPLDAVTRRVVLLK